MKEKKRKKKNNNTPKARPYSHSTKKLPFTTPLVDIFYHKKPLCTPTLKWDKLEHLSVIVQYKIVTWIEPQTAKKSFIYPVSAVASLKQVPLQVINPST